MSDPTPEPGEIRALNGLSWEPWVVVTRVEPDSEGNTVVRFAVLDEMDDDVLTPVPDGLVAGLEQTVGNRLGRQELAEVIDEDPDIDVGEARDLSVRSNIVREVFGDGYPFLLDGHPEFEN